MVNGKRASPFAVHHSLTIKEKEESSMKTKGGFQIGQTVRINDGVMDEDSDLIIGGWHGRVRELDPEYNLMLIELDSVTLRALPSEYVIQAEQGGMDWTTYNIGYDEVQPAAARDTPADVIAAADEVAARVGHWLYLGEEGREINIILRDVDVDDDIGLLEAWCDYFEKTLTFPFKAVVDEYQEPGSPVRSGDELKVVGLGDIDEFYGVLVKVKRRFSTFAVPLCDLKAKDEDSPNAHPVYLYAFWFANI